MKIRMHHVTTGETGGRYRVRDSRLYECEIVEDYGSDHPGMFTCTVRILEGRDKGRIIGADHSQLVH